jgi:hypothetical protein
MPIVSPSASSAGAQLGGDPVDGPRVNLVEKDGLHHQVVAVGMVRRHASLVAEQHRHPTPLHLQLRKQLVGALGGRPAGQHQGTHAVTNRLRDVRRRRLRHVLGVRVDDELLHR